MLNDEACIVTTYKQTHTNVFDDALESKKCSLIFTHFCTLFLSLSFKLGSCRNLNAQGVAEFGCPVHNYLTTGFLQLQMAIEKTLLNVCRPN